MKAPPVLVPPPVRNRLPVWTSTVPGLLTLNATELNESEAVLPERVKVPLLVKLTGLPGLPPTVPSWAWARKVPSLTKSAPSPSKILVSTPEKVAVWPAGLVRDSPTRAKPLLVAASGLRVIPPLAVVVPVPLVAPVVARPLIVPPSSVSRPPTVMAPGSFSVPALIVKVDEVVNADAIESVPPLIVNGAVDVRLLIVSESLSE